ncbi:hypothetical protein [Streptomyces sp. G1]|uniref:hypothetical protein n=1 Tax=Streptomyces sp. G1 TaxID=361572 RepID=UPI00202FEE70|nr:hypothetical protein [Streptomyces sp. G1]MCM1969424.1 hypothetical protein [Streptomyces sp. G1]
MAADFLRRHQSGGGYDEETWPDTMRLLILIYTELTDDGPVLLDFAAKAEEARVSVEDLRAEVEWLVEHEFLALDGDVGGVARLWVNPSVAFLPGTDPRVAAARHRFPYIGVAEGGMSAGQPVIVHPYELELWEAVYDAQRDMFEDPPCFSSDGCAIHGPRTS